MNLEGAQVPHGTARFSCRSPDVNIALSATMRRSQLHHNFVQMYPSHYNIHNSAQRSSIVLCCVLNTFHLPSLYFLYFPTTYLAPQPTFTKRTSGHCTVLFRAVTFSLSSLINLISLATFLPFFLYFASSLVCKGLIKPKDNFTLCFPF